MQSDGREPELGAPIASLDMHMHRLRPIARVEEEPVWPYSENRRHRASSSRLNSAPDRRSQRYSGSAAAAPVGSTVGPDAQYLTRGRGPLQPQVGRFTRCIQSTDQSPGL